MTKFIANIKSTLSTVVLFTATVVMAGLGFAVLGTLALFAVLAIGIAMIAAPFAPRTDDTEIAA